MTLEQLLKMSLWLINNHVQQVEPSLDTGEFQMAVQPTDNILPGSAANVVQFQTAARDDRPNKSETSTTVVPQCDDTPCLYCEIKYCDSHVHRICCSSCQLWACGSCANVGKRKRRYIYVTRVNNQTLNCKTVSSCSIILLDCYIILCSFVDTIGLWLGVCIIPVYPTCCFLTTENKHSLLR